MKKITFLFLMFFMVACGPPIEKKPRTTDGGPSRFKLIERWSSYSNFEIVEVDEHLYLSAYNGGLVHMESCKCKNKVDTTTK